MFYDYLHILLLPKKTSQQIDSDRSDSRKLAQLNSNQLSRIDAAKNQNVKSESIRELFCFHSFVCHRH